MQQNLLTWAWYVFEADFDEGTLLVLFVPDEEPGQVGTMPLSLLAMLTTEGQRVRPDPSFTPTWVDLSDPTAPVFEDSAPDLVGKHLLLS